MWYAEKSEIRKSRGMKGKRGALLTLLTLEPHINKNYEKWSNI